jgi:group I intron endonuclease
MKKISAVYRILNTVSGEFYIGSSKDVMRRWAEHKRPSTWKKCPKNKMYVDMERISTDAFKFEVLEECENLIEREQYWIDVLKPAYNTLKACNNERHGISAVYKITNVITGDFYIGSSVNVKRRWAEHKRPSTWAKHPNSQIYSDMQEHNVSSFVFEIISEFPQELLKIKEQEAIETLHPTYNSCDAYNTEESELLKNKTRNRVYRKTNKDKIKAYNKAHKEERKAYAEAYYEAHKKDFKTYGKAYHEAHKEEHNAKAKAYAEAHKEELKTYKKTYAEAHKEELKAKRKAYAEAHKEELKAKKKDYYKAHKEERKAYWKVYYESHKDVYKARAKAYREAHKNK